VFATKCQILSALLSEFWFFRNVTVFCSRIKNFHISGLSVNTEAHCPIFFASYYCFSFVWELDCFLSLVYFD